MSLVPLSAVRSRGVRPVVSIVVAMAIACSTQAVLGAADKWIEIKSPHVTVMSRSGSGETRTLAWQLEQVRAALVTILPWAQVELDRPLRVLAVDNEQKMRQLAPEYWERKGGVRPVSVWVSGPDQHYLAIRTDMAQEQHNNVNPYISSYFSFASLVLHQSLDDSKAPLWFSRGLAGVLSNTIVQDSSLLVGPPIPWHLEYLRERSRLRLTELLAVSRDSREYTSGNGLERFDAQAWAFVHFLLFSDNGARRSKIDQFFALLTKGTAADAAVAESIGKGPALEADYLNYINRSIFVFGQLDADVSVKRERFAQRTLPPAEAASSLALFHAAMKRPVEARAAIAEARTADPAAADSYAAEAFLLEAEGKPEEARAALTRATENGATIAHAYYALARKMLGPNPDKATLVEVEKLLSRTIDLNIRHAWGYALLGEVRSLLGSTAAMGLVARAVTLEPAEPEHRLTAARILWRARQHEEALKVVQVALSLASNDEARSRATDLRKAIESGRRR